MPTPELAAAAAALVGATISGLFALLTFSATKRAQRERAHGQIDDLYARLTSFRTQHPEVLSLAGTWVDSDWARVYDQQSDADRLCGLYYTYIELCVSFCNAVAYSRHRGYLDDVAFSGQYKSLVKLLLTEHNPAISSLLRSGKYVSAYLQRMHQQFETEGWNWQSEHQLLVAPRTVQIPSRARK